MKSKLKFFADDIMLFSAVHDPSSSALELNRDLQLIYNWALNGKCPLTLNLLNKQWKFCFPTKLTVLFIHLSPSMELRSSGLMNTNT